MTLKKKLFIGLFTALACLVIIVAVFMLKGYLERKQIDSNYREKGIYEIEHSGGYVMVWDSICKFFVVPDPPNSKDEMQEKILTYIEESDLINTIKEEYERTQKIELRFYYPSNKFPLGWTGGEMYDYFSGEIVSNIIVIMQLEWDSEDVNDFEYFWKMEFDK